MTFGDKETIHETEKQRYLTHRYTKTIRLTNRYMTRNTFKLVADLKKMKNRNKNHNCPSQRLYEKVKTNQVNLPSSRMKWMKEYKNKL